MNRLTSLDAFRGITIAGMILVNNPGSGKHVYPPLRHAEWHGWTPADLIFPFFLLIVGVSISLAISKRVAQEVKLKNVYLKIFKRSAILFALGIFLGLFPNFHFADVRIPGVLQRIAICYLVAAILFVKTGTRDRAAVALLLLGTYWAIMKLVPVPGYGAGVLELEGNLCGYIDSQIFGPHLYKPGFDPEGLLSTIPAIATTLIGVLAGDWLRSSATKNRKFIALVLSGFGLVLFGLVLHPFFPINKQLWTSTYVLFTSGAALLLFGICYGIMDILNIRKWAQPFMVFGTNAIALYVGAGIGIRVLNLIKMTEGSHHVPVKTFIYEHFLMPWAGLFLGSLIYPVLLLLLWWGIFFPLYKKKVFIKI